MTPRGGRWGVPHDPVTPPSGSPSSYGWILSVPVTTGGASYESHDSLSYESLWRHMNLCGGRWGVPMNPMIPCPKNLCGGRWGVPHDPVGLAEMMGGAAALVETLDRMLAT